MIAIEQLIRRELYKALESLGGPPALLAATISGATKNEMSAAAERLGADRHLLAAIGSWGDSQDDEQTLADLRLWNAGAAAEDRGQE